MEAFIKDMLLSAGRYVPSNILRSFAAPQTSPAVDAARQKLGGFMKGICHPSHNYKQITDAGFAWFRADCQFPFAADGTLLPDYIRFKENLRAYCENGIRIFLVTPYPREYLAAGIDPRLPENEARIREIAIFLLEDLREYVGAIQITNEMGAPRFTLPLTLDEACRFMGVQLAAMFPRRGDVLIGYNIAGPSANVVKRMQPWHRFCDYVGIDVYIGCFAPVANWLVAFDLMLRYCWMHTGKPVILTEFGYIGAGQPKTKEQRKAILQSYGVESEAEARKDVKAFARRLNPKMQSYMAENASGDWGDFLFLPDFRNHFYKEMPRGFVIKKYPHTPVGQAEFYRDLIPRLTRHPFLLGFCVYCYHDTDNCFCGQKDCPIENVFGITDINGNEKPAYYAIQDALREIK
jgi:hypothetical protein